MAGELWMDGIVEERIWWGQKRRPLIICPEPNGNGYEDRKRDMRQLLRDRWQRGKFARRLARLMRLFLGAESGAPARGGEGNPLLQCAFIDLSKRSAGPSANNDRVAKAARTHAEQLIGQIQSYRPSHILVAGGPARKAFELYLRERLRRVAPDVPIAYVPHPSAYVSNEEYDRQVLEAFTAAGGSRWREIEADEVWERKTEYAQVGLSHSVPIYDLDPSEMRFGMKREQRKARPPSPGPHPR